MTLLRVLAVLGYVVTRQTGRHIRAAILGDVGEHFGLSREDVVERLFGR